MTASVDVLFVTYNHEAYILQALDSILFQKFDRSFRIVVADDRSSDGTLALIRQRAAAVPDIEFKFLESDERLGVTRNYQRGIAACHAEYIAVLEGDDYWTSTGKLQAQFDFLEKNRGFGLCATNYYVVDVTTGYSYPRSARDGTVYKFISAAELVRENLIGNFSCAMYRRAVLATLPPGVFEVKGYDWTVNLCVGLSSLIAMLTEPMSVYRVHAGGTWSGLSPEQKLREQLEMLRDCDRLTGGVLAAEFAALEARLRAGLPPTGYLRVPRSLRQTLMLVYINLCPPLLARLIRGLRSGFRDICPPFVFKLRRWISAHRTAAPK